MKTLSVKQPFAYLLCAGIKDIENRSWRLPEKHRNKWVLIHAGADRKLNLMALTREQYNDACDKFEWNGAMKPVDQWARSAIIGAVKFSDCVINHPSIWAEKSMSYPCDREDEYRDENGNLNYETYRKDIIGYFDQKPIYNWKAEDAILFDKPILNVKGKLSFWDFDLLEEYVKLLK